MNSSNQIAVFGGGCFWCTEACFTSLQGVLSVKSGYCGGHVDRPSYEQVCTKATGHIEVVRIEFNPSVITYNALLEVFFATHDPTTPGRQGNDVGPQYQSAIFYQDVEQQSEAQTYIEQLEAEKHYSEAICTQILPSAHFWPAEQMHDDYFALHPEQGYCQFVIAPKVQKFKKQFLQKLK